MSLIATTIEPRRVTRIFLDCGDSPPGPAELLRIERAIEESDALAQSLEAIPGCVDAIGHSAAERNLPEASDSGAPSWPRRPSMLPEDGNA